MTAMSERERLRTTKDLLVVIESVNFNGGAHVATWAMIDALVARGGRIDVMTASEPTDAMRRRLAVADLLGRAGGRDRAPRDGRRLAPQSRRLCL